ncbi:hypothetical protein [Clostridium sp. AN503]|uniref:hypothetical protein n=1 Tax=Clostridium sp. AN503 TaxID=3160598 RepID=UPI00345856D8
MQTTGIYKLKKPEGTDVVNVDDFNDNADILDRELKKVNDRVDVVKGIKAIALPASGWSGTAPYTQTVSVAGVTAEDAPVIGILIAEGTTAANVKLQNKAWACVDRAVTGAGTITFYCYNKKPGNDFTVNVKGV